MTGVEAGILGFLVLLILLAIRVPIGVSMLATGMVGYVYIAGITPLLSFLKTLTFAPSSKKKCLTINVKLS